MLPQLLSLSLAVILQGPPIASDKNQLRPEAAQSALKKLCDYYDNIQHFDITIASEVKTNTPGQTKLTPFNRTIITRRSNEKFYCENDIPEMNTQNAKRRDISCVNGEGPGSNFSHVSYDPPLRKIASSLRKNKSFTEGTLIINPLHLIFGNFINTSSHYEMKSFAEYAFYKGFTDFHEVLSTTKPNTIEITYRLRKTVLVEFDIDRKYLLLTRAKITDSDKPGFYQEAVSFYETPESIRYKVPNKMKLSYYIEPNKPLHLEDAQLTVHSLNVPLDPKLFQITHMNLPRGTDISGDFFKQPMTWDGQKLILTQLTTLVSEVAQAQAEEAARPRRELLQQGLLAAGLGVALIGAYFLLRYFRQSKN